MADKISRILVVSVVCLFVISVDGAYRRRIPLSRNAIEKTKGPNVCAVEEVNGSRKRYYSECMPRLPRSICGKPTFIRYHCCTGFEKSSDDEKGCLGVRPITDIVSTANDMHFIDFVKNVDTSGLEMKFSEPGPYTVFVPHRRGFASLDDGTRHELSTRDQSKNLLLLHAAEGRYFSHELKDGMELPSLYTDQEQGLLKINKYSNGIRTVNCVRVIMGDIVASNGIMHITEKVIKPFPNRGSVMDALISDDRFSELVTALIVSDVGNELRDVTKTFTIFAPTDSAFRSAPPEIINRILTDKELVKKLLRYHQTDPVICSAAIIGKTSMKSREGQKLNLTCDANDRIRVNDVPVAESDIVALNGVIHVIEELLIPDSVKSIENILEDMSYYKFIEYAQQAGIQDVLSGDAPGNYTIFVPNDAAFKALSRDQNRKLQTDSQYVKSTFRYHVLPAAVTTSDMNDGEMLDTLTQDPVRLSIFQQRFGVNSATIVNPNHKVGNGVVHVIDKVLMPPPASALDIIKQDPRLSTFSSVLQTSGLERELDGPGHFTIFAPSNKAFDRLPRQALEAITKDDAELHKALGYHIVQKTVYSNSLDPGLNYRFDTLAEDDLHISITNKTLVVDNRVTVVEADSDTSTGVIHIIDDVLQCPCVQAFKDI